MNDIDKKEIFKIATLCRTFEEVMYDKINQKKFASYPFYLSGGQEYIHATLAYKYKHLSPMLFGQHRCHSLYLAFGGDITKLIKEFYGLKNGCTNGMGGSASIHCPEINMYGHDGLMGSQIPIAVGACYATKKFTIAFMGDASAEEDYVLTAIAWAGFKKLPMIFIVEDNGLSVLTKKELRRDWNIVNVAKSFGLDGFDTSDNPEDIFICLGRYDSFPKFPVLLNIDTVRIWSHNNASIDPNRSVFDRYRNYNNEKFIDSSDIALYVSSKNMIEDKFKEVESEL